MSYFNNCGACRAISTRNKSVYHDLQCIIPPAYTWYISQYIALWRVIIRDYSHCIHSTLLTGYLCIYCVYSYIFTRHIWSIHVPWQEGSLCVVSVWICDVIVLTAIFTSLCKWLRIVKIRIWGMIYSWNFLLHATDQSNGVKGRMPDKLTKRIWHLKKSTTPLK